MGASDHCIDHSEDFTNSLFLQFVAQDNIWGNFHAGNFLWQIVVGFGGYAPIFTKLQVGVLTIYYNIKKKGTPLYYEIYGRPLI